MNGAGYESVTWRIDGDHGPQEVRVGGMNVVGKRNCLVDLHGLASSTDGVEDEEESVTVARVNVQKEIC